MMQLKLFKQFYTNEAILAEKMVGSVLIYAILAQGKGESVPKQAILAQERVDSLSIPAIFIPQWAVLIP